MRKIFLLVIPYIFFGCNSKNPNNTNEQIDYFDQYADDSFRDSIFKIAIQNESTAPNYVVFTAVNINSGTKKEICCEAPFLSGAIHREFNLPYDQVGFSKVDIILYSNQNRVFNFSSIEALNNIDFFNYPEYDRIIEIAKATDLDYYQRTFSSGSASKLKYFETDTGFQQISFAHILFNSGILVRRDCEAGNNIWIGGSLPKVPTINLEEQIQDEDALRNPYHNAYMSDTPLKDVGKLILIDSIQPMDNNVTFRLLDTISTCPLEDLPFFLSVYDTIIAQADGALAEVMGLYSWKFVKQRPNEFRDHLLNIDKSIVDKWANFIVYEMYFAYPEDSLEYYCIEFVEDLKDGNVSNGLTRFGNTMTTSAKSIIED